MSIANEITRITNEVDIQADLIRQIKSALNRKAAGESGNVPDPILQDETITENVESTRTED